MYQLTVQTASEELGKCATRDLAECVSPKRRKSVTAYSVFRVHFFGCAAGTTGAIELTLIGESRQTSPKIILEGVVPGSEQKVTIRAADGKQSNARGSVYTVKVSFSWSDIECRASQLCCRRSLVLRECARFASEWTGRRGVVSAIFRETLDWSSVRRLCRGEVEGQSGGGGRGSAARRFLLDARSGLGKRVRKKASNLRVDLALRNILYSPPKELELVRVKCPHNCGSPAEVLSVVTGASIHPSVSSICDAAVHDGVISVSGRKRRASESGRKSLVLQEESWP